MMKKLIVLIVAVAVMGWLTGCMKPPKDVARKIALSYLEREELTMGDIKYLSTSSKEGGYSVNIQAGDALCTMTMTKGDKEWTAKGVSCNGRFLPQGKVIERRRARYSAEMKQSVAEANAKGPQTTKNGARMEKLSFDGATLSRLMVFPLKAAAYPSKVKKSATDKFVSGICETRGTREALDVGIGYKLDIRGSDGNPITSVTVTDKDCY